MARSSQRRLGTLILTAALALAFASPVSAAPRLCAGVAQLTGVTSAPVVRTADGTTFVTFTFVGTHTLCLEGGAVVSATIAGRLWQRTAANGDLGLRFEETLSYAGGTLDFRGQGTLAGGVWTSAVRTVGPGTGSLAGIHGQGRFWPTGPTSFGDAIAYTYR